MKAQYKIRL